MSGPNIKIYFFPWLEQWKSMKVIELLTLWCRKKKSIKQLLLYSCKSKHCIPMHTKAKDVQWSYSPTQARLYRLYRRYRPVCARLSQKSECRNKASCNFFADGGSCLEFIKNVLPVKRNKVKHIKMRYASVIQEHSPTWWCEVTCYECGESSAFHDCFPSIVFRFLHPGSPNINYAFQYLHYFFKYSQITHLKKKGLWSRDKILSYKYGHAFPLYLLSNIVCNELQFANYF